MLPNQVSVQNEDEMHIIESNVLYEDKTETLHSNCKIKHQKNNNLCNVSQIEVELNKDASILKILFKDFFFTLM